MALLMMLAWSAVIVAFFAIIERVLRYERLPDARAASCR